MFEELALYTTDQILPTHVVHFKLAKSGTGTLVAQQLYSEQSTAAHDRSLEEVIAELAMGEGAIEEYQIDDRRTRACKWLGDVARDDHRKASAKFLSNRKLAAQLGSCARSSNEALQFEALRAWWNFSFNDMDNQRQAMQSLGASLLTSLLDSPNQSLQLRAVGLIWNLGQHSEENRLVFAEAGALQRLGRGLVDAQRRAFASSSPPWGQLQLLLGALANLAMTCGDQLRNDPCVTEAASSLMEERVVPPVVLQQATRLVCNTISHGDIDPEWQATGYCYRTSAPKDLDEASCIS